MIAQAAYLFLLLTSKGRMEGHFMHRGWAGVRTHSWTTLGQKCGDIAVLRTKIIPHDIYIIIVVNMM